MNVHLLTPFSIDKNLGAAYNRSLSLIPDDDWVCLIDYDVLLLTPDAGNIIHEYAARNLDAGLITCYTNRVSPKSTAQLLTGSLMECSDIKSHILLAEEQRKHLYQITEINQDISGMLMMISKRTWNEFKFSESGKCLGVDTEYNRRLRAAGKKILRADGLYCFHTYRMTQGIKSKSHLL